MTQFKTSLALLAALSLAAPMAVAQETASPAAPAAEAPAATTAAPATDAATPPAASAEGPGTTYIAKTEGDWQVQCLRTEDGKDPCEIFQLLTDKDGNKVASISVMALASDKEAVAGATITTPLESLLTAGVKLQIDDQKPIALPYNFCSRGGCFANVALRPAELDLFKKGTKIGMTVVPVAAPDKKVDLTISLKGFTAAFDAMSKPAE